MKEWQLKKGIKMLGLPKGTKFEGYVVHLLESDEFLTAYENDEGAELWGWGPKPDYAIKYKRRDQAKATIRGYDKAPAEVVALLDIGRQYMTLTLDDVDYIAAS